MPIYHITSTAEADKAGRLGEYVPKNFAAEGFIHCSYANQFVRVANQRFRGQADLVLLEIDTQKLNCRVVDENLEGGAEKFPHIYGALPISAVVRIYEFPCDANGGFETPACLTS